MGSALLEVRGFNTDREGRVVASFAHRIRGDRAEYVVRLPQEACSPRSTPPR